MSTPENKPNSHVTTLRIFGNGLIMQDVPGVIDPDCVFNCDKQIYEPRKKLLDQKNGKIKIKTANPRP